MQNNLRKIIKSQYQFRLEYYNMQYLMQNNDKICLKHFNKKQILIESCISNNNYFYTFMSVFVVVYERKLNLFLNYLNTGIKNSRK